ncbi:helix-turn-helix domain-containing protein [Microbispora sp. RL4-1S]|uniref:Helix-turn-helix domain-containing protein n=1 Tax=Microbispora oryzae TaxID=2806554 RepID=A0A940WJF7_9ACTN|nr:XRE family transcriptional regulator [Microbispora oryzae]MBP2704377.1 helix-turn-helix domain-containing protein [Microbispora oryzae]
MNPRMLVTARESRGLSQKELAEMAGVPSGTLSKAENGLTDLTEDRLVAIARVLDYPRHMLDWPDPIYTPQSSGFYHRKQQSLPQKALNKAHASVNLLRIRLSRLSEGVTITPRFPMPALASDDDDQTPESIAQRVRHIWALPSGPVDNMIAVLEAAGAFVVRRDLGSPRISAISLRISGDRPLFVLNEGMPPDRERFSLAHELGHLVMHEFLPPQGEREADRFASEFLMPSDDIRPHLYGLDLRLAARLKPYWKTSMASIIRKANTLEVITPTRYKSLIVQMAQRGMNKVEPVDLPREEPTVIDAIVDVHRRSHGYTEQQLAHLSGLLEDEYRVEFATPTLGGLRVVR